MIITELIKLLKLLVQSNGKQPLRDCKLDVIISPHYYFCHENKLILYIFSSHYYTCHKRELSKF